MTNLINTTNIHTVNYINDRTITRVRSVVKTRLGMTVCDARDFDMPRFNKHPESLITNYKKGTLQTVQVELDNSGHFLTVFSRTGKTVKLIEDAILRELTVGTINSLYYNTNLYSSEQYRAVEAKSWASKAYIANQPLETATTNC